MATVTQKRFSIFVLFAILLLEHGQAFWHLLPWRVHLAAIALVGVVVLALKLWSLAHLTAFLWILVALTAVDVAALQVSAVSLLVAFALSTLIVRSYASTKDLLSWLRPGHIDRLSVALMFITSLAAALALILWAEWSGQLGVGLEMMRGLAHYPPWLVAGLGLPLFAALNALSEEVVYRGIFQEALSLNISSTALVLLLQASAFAAIHYAAGFPNGAVGFGMVFTWGMMLGYLRHRTHGLLAPYLVHVAADLTIVFYLYAKV